MSLQSNPHVPTMALKEQVGQAVKTEEKTKPKAEKKGKTAQGTAFLRRRKVVKILAERAQAGGELLEPNEEEGKGLQKFADYPILDLSEEFQGCIDGLSPQQYHARRLLTPEEDPNLCSEFWAIQGAVIGVQLDVLPIITEHSEVHSMDLLY